MVLLRFCTPEVRWGSLKAQPSCGHSSEPRHHKPCVSSPGAFRTSSKARLATLRNGLWAFPRRTGRFLCSAAVNEGKQDVEDIGSGEQVGGVAEENGAATSEVGVVEDWGSDPPQKDWDGATVIPRKKRGIIAAIVGVFILIGGTIAAIQAIGSYKASDAYKTSASAAPPVSTERDTSEGKETQADKTAGTVAADDVEDWSITTAAAAGDVAIQPDKTAVELPAEIPVQDFKEVEQWGATVPSMEGALDVEVGQSGKFEVDSAASDLQSPSDAGQFAAAVFTDEVIDTEAEEAAEKAAMEAAKAAEIVEALGAMVAAEANKAVEAIKDVDPSKAAEIIEAVGATMAAEATKAVDAIKAVEAAKAAEAAETVQAVEGTVAAEATRAVDTFKAFGATKEAEATKAVDSFKAFGATKEAEATKAVDSFKAFGATKQAEATEAVKATKADATEAVEATKADATKAVESIKAGATKAAEIADEKTAKAVEAMEAEAAKAVEAVKALEDKSKAEPVATVALAKEILSSNEALDVEAPPKPTIEIAGAVSEKQVAEIASGKSVDDLRQRAILAARASTVASEAARRAAAYATVSSKAASEAAFAAERGASATGAALAAMELGAEEAIVEVGQDTSEMEAERRAMRAAELAAESEKRAAEAAGLASAHTDVADRQAEIAEELSSLHKSRTTELVEQVRNTVTAFWVESRDFAVEVATMIRQWVINLAHGLSEFWPALVEKAENGERSIVASFKEFWSSVGAFSGTVVASIQNQLSSAGEFVGGLSSIGDVMRDLAATLTNFSKNLISTIGTALGKSVESIRSLSDSIAAYLKGLVQNFK
ncbi:hypothetical protein BSKO_00553 [Bryopsis sp. KO-2023]|nr:hypothetical protein BSKO_00553 [Bryopsis sp. KO-2023]